MFVFGFFSFTCLSIPCIEYRMYIFTLGTTHCPASLRQGSTDKALGLENTVLCPESVNRLGLGVDPGSFAIFKGGKARLDGLKHLFLGIELGFGDSVCFLLVLD